VSEIAANAFEARPLDTRGDELAEVFSLYRKNSATLGFLPLGAFEQFAREGRILVTYSRSGLEGYLAYRVAGQDAVIVHLCVRKESRGSSLSSLLLEELFRQTADLNTVRLSCREEYSANRLWPRHDFVCDSEKSGRGSDGARLFLWTRRQADVVPPLLAAINESQREGRRVVVIDANVYYDLDSDEPRAEESKALLADWLASDIVVVVTAELNNEIARQEDVTIRERSRTRLRSFEVLRGSIDQVAAFRELIDSVLPTNGSKLTDSDESDRRQLAHAAAKKADFFVTRDQNLLNHADALETVLGVAVLRPADLVVHLHQRGSRNQYTPARLVGTTVNRRRPANEGELAPFQRFGQSESKAEWLSLSRKVCSDPVRYHTFLLEPPDAPPRVLVALDSESGAALSIEVFRGLSHPLTPTLLRRVLSEVLVRAQDDGQKMVVCRDAGDPLVKAALTDLGFASSEAGYIKPSIREVVPVEDVAACIAGLDTGDFRLPVVAEPVEMERHYWPLKVVGAGIPTFVIPIQPHWAAQLFDARLAEADLFGAKAELALALENVYYSASNVTIPAGARILWYVSGKKPRRVAEIRACSICQETVTGTASSLFRQFARLGIYQWRDMKKAAGDDLSKPLRAYRFALTERFSHPVRWDRFQQILIDEQGYGNPCASPTPVPEGAFQDIYSEGTELVSEHAAVVVSIKPQYVEAIREGRKTVELRRKFPAVKAGMWLVIYATQPVGAVVGMASIVGVERRAPAAIWKAHQQSVAVSKDFYDQYFDGYDMGYAVKLGEFRPLESTSVVQMGKILPGFRPPQSYRYLGPKTLRRLVRVAGGQGQG
jgi:predicted transcriptional regulator/predicted nucleic acid-binding protein/GNAT superfamily N-acetyltransferase